MKPISVEGRCRCGDVAFRLREEPISFYLCHCRDCQAESGSAFGQTMHVRRRAVTDIRGSLVDHEMFDPDGSGACVVLSHCGRCLTVLWAARVPDIGVIGLNAGALDDVAGLTPYGNMWTRRARPWVALAPGPSYPESPDDPLAMIKAWQARPGREG